MTRQFVRACAAIAALACSATSAVAQIAPGSQLYFKGVANATDIGSAGVVLEFQSWVSADHSHNTGSFASLNSTTGSAVSGAIRSVTVGNGPQPITSFLTLGGYQFNVQALPSGPYSQAECYVDPVPGQTCTPYQSPSDALSPFYLANDYSGDPDMPFNSIAAFNLVGSVIGPDGSTSRFLGTISATFEGLSYQEALYGLEQYGLENVPFTGMFVAVPNAAVLPEPSSYVLVATGLAGLVAVARRRRR